MREGKIEKIKRKTDEIKVFIKGEIEKFKDEITPSPLRMVDRKLLIPSVEELFFMVRSKSFEAAGPKLKAVLEEIENLKDPKARESNIKFVRSFDHEIEKGLEVKSTKETNEQDNT